MSDMIGNPEARFSRVAAQMIQSGIIKQHNINFKQLVPKFFFYSVLRPFQDYFSSYETGLSVGGRKRENPEKNHLAHLQAELGLSHMWPERGSNPHQTQR